MTMTMNSIRIIIWDTDNSPIEVYEFSEKEFFSPSGKLRKEITNIIINNINNRIEIRRIET